MALRLAVFFRSLSELHGSGIAWPEALEAALGGRDRRGGVSPEWELVVTTVRAGTPLSDAIGDLVPPIDRAGIRAAEASGRMEELLAALAVRHEGLDRRAQAERGALAYPVLLAHVAAVLSALPDLFQGRTGRALVWALALLVPTHVWLLARRRMKAAEYSGAKAPEWMSFLRTKSSVDEADARSLEALGWLHDAGVPPLEALPLAAAAGVGGRASDDLVDAWTEVRAGRAIHGGFTRVPPDVRSALITGETTGRLAQACARTAQTLSESAAHRREVWLARAKPIAVLVVGSLIGLRIVMFYAGYFSDVMRMSDGFK